MFFASIGIIAALRLTDAINGPTGFVLLALAMLLMIPIARAGRRQGSDSPAMYTYNRRMMIAAIGYVLGLGIAISLWRNFELSTPIVLALSFLPTLPTFGMIWAMARYLLDESDEYLRHRTIIASVIGLGVVLGLGIFWGFLEMFELVPHIWAWWVLPVWALGQGVSHLWMKAREQ